MNNRGLRTEPWGTPCKTVEVEEVWPESVMKYFLSVRYDNSQSRVEPSTPSPPSLWRRIEWLTVSKAVLRSNRRRMLWAPVSAEVRRSLMTLTRAVSVQWMGGGTKLKGFK